MPSVFSHTYFPLEVKAECLHSRCSEGVALSNVVTPLPVSHPHTPSYSLCVFFMWKILPLCVSLYVPGFQLTCNFSCILNFYKQVHFMIGKQAKVQQATMTQSRFLFLGLFLFCPLPWAISPSSMAWSPPSCAWVQMSFCSSDLRWLTHNFNCLPGRFSWTYHRKFVMATADGWWVVRAHHLDFWPGDQWKRGLHFCGGRAEMKCGSCWQLFSSSDACS